MLLHHGHAYGGCWLVDRTLPDAANDDQQAIRKLVELEELSDFELTLWKSRLLDLSLRNRLLNFRLTKGTVQILSAAPEHVEDELAANVELKLAPRPALMARQDPRDAATYTRQQATDALTTHLHEELKQGRLHTALTGAEHQQRLTELYRAARLGLEENGTHTLFAAVGVLEWRETEHSDRTLRAPLLPYPTRPPTCSRPSSTHVFLRPTSSARTAPTPPNSPPSSPPPDTISSSKAPAPRSPQPETPAQTATARPAPSTLGETTRPPTPLITASANSAANVTLCPRHARHSHDPSVNGLTALRYSLLPSPASAKKKGRGRLSQPP